MADNVAITQGSGTTVSTEEITTLNGGSVSAQHGQRVILSLRTADATAIDLPGSAADGLLVNLGSNNDVVVTNAGTFAVQAAQSGTWNITNISGTISLPTGAATAAKQDTIIGHVDGLEGLLTTIDTDTGNIATSAASIDGKITACNTGAVVISSGTITTVTTVTTCSTLTGGGIAHDSADSGNPHKIGTKAIAAQSGLTLVAANDRSDLYSDLDGAALVRGPCSLGDIVRGLAAITDGSSTSVIAAQGSGIKTYITTVIIANSSASNVTVDLRDGTGGSVLATFPVPANGGVVCNLPVPIPFSANTAVAADPSAAASTVTVTLLGFKSKV